MLKVPLKCYPSGFMGSITVSQTEPIDIATIVRQPFMGDMLRPSSKYTANADVCALVNTYMTKPPNENLFNIYEKAIVCGKTAFGAETVFDWVEAQTQCPEFEPGHMTWIDETLMYLLARKPRSMSNMTWSTILKADASGLSKTKLSPVVEHIFLDRNHPPTSRYVPSGMRKAMTINDLILLWARAPNGMDDYISSLGVLFGQR